MLNNKIIVFICSVAFRDKHLNPGFVGLRLLIHVIKSEMLGKLQFVRLELMGNYTGY